MHVVVDRSADMLILTFHFYFILTLVDCFVLHFLCRHAQMLIYSSAAIGAPAGSSNAASGAPVGSSSAASGAPVGRSSAASGAPVVQFKSGCWVVMYV